LGRKMSEEGKKEESNKERRFDPELLKKGLKCDLDQYEMLKCCSDAKDTTEWNEWRRNNPDEEILLEGVDITSGNLSYANLREAKLNGSNLKKSNLGEVHLEEALLIDSHLEGAYLYKAHLQGALFQTAIVDGETLILECEIDRKTNFDGVGLGDVRIDPQTKQLLEYNIRRKNWEDWYKEHWFWRWPFRLFWFVSDYGMSGKRVAWIFLLLALLFAAVYMNWAYWAPPGVVYDLSVEPIAGEAVWHYSLRAAIRPIYFSVVTMTTLGFGDMYANKESIAGHVLLILQVILGYVLLGALVTRFAVLFTAGGPAGKFAEKKREERRNEETP
jgi:hypothetical protein